VFPAKGAGLFHERRVTSERVISVGRRSYLKPNKVSKNDGVRKVEHKYHF